MTENALISVIVPVYNVENYVAECLESIIVQTYNNIEIVLINDGSTDKSEEVCLKYAKKDERIHYFYKENSGIAATRNYGIKIAKGKYITFIDSDDCVNENFIKVLYEGIKQTGCKIVQCSLNTFTDTPQILSKLSWEYKTISSFEFLSKTSDITGSSTLWSKIYDKELFNDIEFPNGKIHEDIAVIYKLIDKCDKIAITYDKVYFYRTNLSGITKKKFETDRIDIIDIFYEEALYYRDKGYKNLYIIKSNEIIKNIVNFLSMNKNSFVDKKEFEKHLLKKYSQIQKNISKMPIKKSFSVIIFFSGKSLFGFKILASIKNILKVFRGKFRVQFAKKC